MIIDTLTTFAYDLPIHAAQGSNVVIGDQLDLLGLGLQEGSLGNQRDIGISGIPVYLYMAVGSVEFEADDVANPSAVTLQLVTADDSALTTNVEVVHTVTFSADAGGLNYTPGTVLAQIVLPGEGPFQWRRYVGLRRTIASEDLASGNLYAFLQLDPKGWRAYPSDTGA